MTNSVTLPDLCLIEVSYSHKDGHHKDKFEEHLTVLQRRGLLESWSDTEVLAGSPLSSTISEELKTCDFFFALVSSSYIQSTYCFERELNVARLREDRSECVVIPIIVEHLVWEDLGIDRVKMVPKDGRPVADFDNVNEAWSMVVREIERALGPATSQPSLKKRTKAWCEDTEVVYQSRSAGSQFRLSDIYVFPDLRALEEEIGEGTTMISSRELVNAPGHYLLVADEQSGKTALCRRLFAEMFDAGKVPVYLTGAALSSGSFQAVFENAMREQYHAPPEVTECVLLIDDMDLDVT